ncbi:MAG TPA: vitamin B12-dependent ribonucleotide reductase, partial [Acidobacteriaceae bacterium]|nr:vitamin B12-dependent ribonucleotide reductase [Acidobacteriaceae bacterium]
RDGSKGAQPLNVSDGKGAKAIKSAKENADDVVAAAADRVLAALSTGTPAAEADVKTLEAKISERIEVTARSIVDATAAFTTTLGAITRISSQPVPDQQDSSAPPRAVRHRLPEERASLTHKFGLAGHEGYITVGLYPNGQPGEIFIKMAKEGSTVSGLMDSFATAISLALQHGVPLKVLCEKFAHSRFEPSGWTGNEQIGYAKSIMDYIFRWLQLRFLSGQQLSLFAGLAPAAPPLAAAAAGELPLTPEQHTPTRGMGSASAPQGGIASELTASNYDLAGMPKVEDRGIYHAADAMRSMYEMGDAPSCHTCGAIMVRNGSCYRCMSCGSTSGCS